MIRELHINNYKSLHELTLNVGRFNVFIGENGCGKSNLLEAIALAAAAAADKLDHEFLTSRGIRVTEPQLMRSAFSNESLLEPIEITVGFENLDNIQKYTLTNDNQAYSKWIIREDYNIKLAKALRNWKPLSEQITKPLPKHEDKKDIKKIFSDIEIISPAELYDLKEQLLNFTTYEDKIKNFIIYSPENTALRNFYKEGQIEPLGINGEGLLKLLKVIQSKSDEQRQEIHACLQLFDWYDELEIPKDLSASEDKVTINDRYLTQVFDQRSANEGFLFVLFYIALMVSDDTPKIFAIDNIDTSLNPKLCTRLIKEMVPLAKKYGKQVFVTTHNPAILDGIDLGDDEQRLLVVSRNKLGHTRFKRITVADKPRSSTDEDLKLSEAFLRGYLGGLPKGF